MPSGKRYDAEYNNYIDKDIERFFKKIRRILAILFRADANNGNGAKR